MLRTRQTRPTKPCIFTGFAECCRLERGEVVYFIVVGGTKAPLADGSLSAIVQQKDHGFIVLRRLAMTEYLLLLLACP
jgi:hypothetical protein